MQIREFVLQSRDLLTGLYPPEEAKALVDVVCREILGLESYAHIINPTIELKGDRLERANDAMSRLKKNEPIQYVLGYCEFFGQRYNVNESVLIPRPETETLCKLALEFAGRLQRTRSAYGKDADAVRILDLCTGSGCIAWTMALNVPGSLVMAVDISDKALEVSSNQRFPSQKCVPPRFVKADIFDDDALDEALDAFSDDGQARFDLILSNPPYIMESERSAMSANVLDYEPSLALFVPDGDSMLFNKKIAEICQKRLYTDSLCIVEINEALGEPAVQIFKQKGFKNVKLHKDVFCKNRFISFHK